MADKPRVILTGFADEAANNKLAIEQFAAFAALGLQYYSIRFIDLGDGVKNVMQLTKAEVNKVRKLQNEYGLNVSSIGSPIGKVKLEDVDDGTSNKFIPFKKYLNKDVKKVCDLAHAFETKLIRGFSFYHPKDSKPPRSSCQGRRPTRTDRRSLPSLGPDLRIGSRSQSHRGRRPHACRNLPSSKPPSHGLDFDGANIVVQGYTQEEVYDQYLAMKPGLGWLHIKDYLRPMGQKKGGHVNEDTMAGFVPSDRGYTGHEAILRDFATLIPKLERSLKRRGIPGVFVDMEPHVKGGGQFGGFSGPDGMGVALRSFTKVLDYVGIDYHLRDFEDIRAARGF